MLDSAEDASLCLCMHLPFFNMHRCILVPYKHLLVLRVFVPDIPVPWCPCPDVFIPEKTAILQRMLKASHNFPVTNCTLRKSTLIAEISTTTPAYPYQHDVWPQVLHLDPSFVFSFHLSELPPFTSSYSLFLQP